MFDSAENIQSNTPGFSMERNFRFSQFAPRVFNYVTKKAGMRPHLIMPARAFCSDGTQGYPTMLLAKHFGTFPFDFGQIGGTFEFLRSAAFTGHGRDLVIIQATHVGYDPATKAYGKYPRHRASTDSENLTCTGNCGLVGIITGPYVAAYKAAAESILVSKTKTTDGGEYQIRISNIYLAESSTSSNGAAAAFRVKLDTGRMLRKSEDSGRAEFVASDPVSRTFVASAEFARHLDAFTRFADAESAFVSIGDALTREWFKFEHAEKSASASVAPPTQYEENLRNEMEWIATQPAPLLAAAQVCAQVEFQRFLSEMHYSKATFEGRNFFYVAGIMVDVAPSKEQLAQSAAFYPRSLFVPWAAYVQRYENVEVQENGAVVKTSGKFISEVWDQDRVFKELSQVDAANPFAMSLEGEMEKLLTAPEIKL